MDESSGTEDTQTTQSNDESLSINLDDLDEKEDTISTYSSTRTKEECEKVYGEDDRFLANLNDMRHQGIYTDFDIICRHKSFSAHKLILTAVCPYFDRILLSDDPETLIMNDLDPDVMEPFLEMLYTGSTNLAAMNKTHLRELLTVARKFEFLYFERLLLERLLHQLNPLNFSFALFLTRTIGDAKSRAKIIEYLAKNMDKVVTEEDFFTCLSEEDIADMLLEASSQMLCHDILLTTAVSWMSFGTVDRSQFFTQLMGLISLRRISKTMASSMLEQKITMDKLPELKAMMEKVRDSPT